MKIFISWSGDRSEALAIALKEWLPLVLHYADPWLSKSDIGAGDRWTIEIAKELEACNFGIICITRENRDAPWILFEAGALAKSMQNGKVIPLLLDVDKKEITGPLAQFQAKKVEESEIKDLIQSVNRSATNPVADGYLEKLFTMAWPDLQSKIAAIPEIKATAKPARPEGEILEELVSGFRNLEMRFMVMKDMDTKTHELEMRRLEMESHLMMINEEEAARRRRKGPKGRAMELMAISHRIISSPDDPLQILFAASVLREDAPWFYELALDTYRDIKSGSRGEALSSYKRLIDAFKMLKATPLNDEIGQAEMKMISRMLEELFSRIANIAHGSVAEPAIPSDPALMALQEAFETGISKKASSE